MNEGTVVIVISFPQPWPVPGLRVLASNIVEEKNVVLSALPQGSLKFTVEKNGATLTEFTSQKLFVEGRGNILVIMVWSGNQASIHINGDEIPSIINAPNLIHVVKTKKVVPAPLSSLDSPDANIACKNWMQWRQSRFATPKTAPKKNRRIKTDSEQFEELKTAIESLKDLCELVSQGKNHFIGHLATDLRSLLYWKDNTEGNYSPILLRFAGKLDSPLPIFITHQDTNPPALIKEAVLDFQTGQASIIKQHTSQVLADIQDWLSMDTLSVKVPRGNTDGSLTEEIKTLKELILHFATILGSSHYDEDLLDVLELSIGMEGPKGNLLPDLILNVAEITVGLGYFIVDKYDSQNTKNST